MSISRESKGSIVLKIIIVLLMAVLVYVIYEPYQIQAQEEAYRMESRLRMLNIRAAQLQYIGQNGRYSSSLDSLITFIQTLPDSTRAEAFVPLTTGTFVPESLQRAPKSDRAYVLLAVDTSAIKKYLLEDPDGYGSIGSLTDDSRVNKASWED
jgi:Tfp pilus assembly protein PilE